MSVRLFTGNRWSTANPVMMRDQDFGIVHLQAFGSYDFRIIVRNFFCGKSPVLTMNVVQRARSKPTAFQAVSFQQVGSDGCLEPAEHVGLAGPRVPPMKKLPLAGGAGATFSRARSLPPSGGSFFKMEEFSEAMRSRIVSIFSDALASSKVPALDVAMRYSELGDALSPIINPALQGKYGIEMTSFIVESIPVPPELEHAIDKRSSM